MSIFKRIRKARVLVIGDLMLDRYWWGDVTRISPEAPVPVVKLNRSSLALGGAANVALNISGLGAEAVLIGCNGTDTESEQFGAILTENGINSESIVRLADRPTTSKTRVIAHSQQVARIDQESTDLLSEKAEDTILARVHDLLESIDAVVLSDYAKGVLTDRILANVISRCKELEKPVLVDPKGRSFSKYAGCTIITPNRREAAEACGLDEDSIDMVKKAGTSLLKDLGIRAVLVTEGEQGMTLFRNDVADFHIPTAARAVYDVTGAGDTVIATLASAVAAGCDLETSARLANLGAGIVVEQIGTSAISATELEAAWEQDNLSNERSA